MKTIKLDEQTRKKISDRIKDNYNVKDIILFGSYADGNPDEDSDIDLVVILNERKEAEKYLEMSERRLGVKKLLRDIRKNISMDILVYTIFEWKKLISINNYFIREIVSKGVSIL